ncbi:DsbA family oxidoreductase [Denitromonas ohlonensis]|uniref:DsbA family oxidoreductase n=2 Tax=Denitromonas TaxID=139331 RepID=A0A557S9P2_9RHOO|nr:DsbA family oxidoreductase [Denitromonas ohlonensis]TVO63596.1 DsbA family oxidoreductase [Denitromonas ohlonensis]TVO74130.1 DsbA family oxidoreductase [Denitromonas ohlonensis]
MTHTLNVQVHFDLICPWCFIGKRHLDTALARFAEARPEVAIEVLWIAHELLPDTPPEGLPYQAFYEKRLGGPAAVAARRAQVQAAARSAGIHFAFDQIASMPNTRRAHRLLTESASSGNTGALIERLFTAWFVEGQDIGDSEVLSRLACAAPADRSATDLRQRVVLAERTTTTGVPLFVFNERVTLSGAQPPDALLDGMYRATGALPLAAAPT